MDILQKLIIDFKPISPKYGDLFCGKDPVLEAIKLEKKGVLGISVVTKSQHFGGSMDLLKKIRRAVKTPILRKDFITSEDEIKKTADLAVEGILLIEGISKKIEQLYSAAIRLGITPVVEVHSEKGLEIATKLGAKVVSINNKNIKTFELESDTIERTKGLIKYAPKDAFLISASGVRSNNDIEELLSLGANAVIVGTAFWKCWVNL